MDKVFVDAGAFIALAATADIHHKEAEAIYRHLVSDKIQLVTTNHIVDETCTFLLRDTRLGHPAAVRFGEFINSVSVAATVDEISEGFTSASRMLLLYSSPTIEQEAWRVFGKYDNAGFSFTDCTSFAVMSLLSITTAFTLDSHYDVMGFQRIQAPP